MRALRFAVCKSIRFETRARHAQYKTYAYVRPENLATGWSCDRIVQEINALGVPCLLAPQTEWLQTYIPGRGASLADALADVLGLAVGVVWALLLRRSHQRRAAMAGGASVATAAVTPTAT